jgi:hypothetical protein
VPPAPLQVIVKLAFADNAPVRCEPLAASAPLQAPDAAHEVAFVDAQVNSLESPASIVAGEAVMVAVGTGGGELDAPPPPHEVKAATPAARRNLTGNRTKSLQVHWFAAGYTRT